MELYKTQKRHIFVYTRTPPLTHNIGDWTLTAHLNMQTKGRSLVHTHTLVQTDKRSFLSLLFLGLNTYFGAFWDVLLLFISTLS